MNSYDMIVAVFVSVMVSWGIAYFMIRLVVNDLASQINDANTKMQQAINGSRDDFNRKIEDAESDIFRSINEINQNLSLTQNREALISELECTNDKKDIRRVVENRI
jgi:mannitol-specific phosphotransferase system IIBC component